MILVTVKAPTGDVDFQIKPNSVLVLMVDGEGSVSYMRTDASDFAAAVSAVRESARPSDDETSIDDE